jgi:hypothetical protein
VLGVFRNAVRLEFFLAVEDFPAERLEVNVEFLGLGHHLVFFFLDVMPDALGEELNEELRGDADNPCPGCWARHVCGHSSYVASSQDAEDTRAAGEDRCALWRTEVEVALRFYHRLAHTDPLQVRQLFDESLREPAPAASRREDLGHLRMPF